MPNDLNAIQGVLNGLAAYLTAQLTGVAILKEWPAANQQLVYPSLTIFTGQSTYMNRPPEQVSITAPDVNNQVTVTEIIGEYDFKMQLDLWCATKLQRDTVLGQVLGVFSASENPMGLSLRLANYFNEWVRFDLDGHSYIDDEAAAQRQERRAKIDVLVNCRAIRTRTAYAMVTLQTEIAAALTDPANAPLEIKTVI